MCGGSGRCSASGTSAASLATVRDTLSGNDAADEDLLALPHSRASDPHDRLFTVAAINGRGKLETVGLNTGLGGGYRFRRPWVQHGERHVE